MSYIGSAPSGQALIALGKTGVAKFYPLGTNSGLTLNGVLLGGNNNAITATSKLNNGQLVIGSTAGTPAAANLTAGTGVLINNGSNSITINSTGGGVSWFLNSGVFTALRDSGYIVTGASTITLPTNPATGSVVTFVCGTASVVTLQSTGTQRIRLGALFSSQPGTLASTSKGDTITLVYNPNENNYYAISAIGNWTIT